MSRPGLVDVNNFMALKIGPNTVPRRTDNDTQNTQNFRPLKLTVVRLGADFNNWACGNSRVRGKTKSLGVN
jgi:hypothetical protein